MSHDLEQFVKDIDAPGLLAAELQRCEAPMAIDFDPFSVLGLCGLLQLACRHPGVTGANRQLAQTFLDAARLYFAESPLVLAVLDQGDDPNQDVAP